MRIERCTSIKRYLIISAKIYIEKKKKNPWQSLQHDGNVVTFIERNTFDVLNDYPIWIRDENSCADYAYLRE